MEELAFRGEAPVPHSDACQTACACSATVNVVLGGQIFGPDSEDIHVVGSGVSDTDVVALGAKLVTGEFWRVKAVVLVSCQACRARLKFLRAV
jgi:hypothetical protein